MQPHHASSHRRPIDASAAESPPRPGPWSYAISPDRRWALVCDAAGRNLAEVHRPAVAIGPDGRLLTFEQVVRLMCAAPELLALLEASVMPGGIGPHEFGRPGGYRERALAALTACR